MNLRTKDEIFSAMVVYGFLNYENGYVTIPNKELMDKFEDMIQKESSLGILAVGIAYDKQTKKHECIVETLREKINR